MMQPNNLEIVRTTQITPGPAARGKSVPSAAWLAGLALLALAAALAFASSKQLRAFMSDLDSQSLDRAGALLDRTIEQQKADLLSEVRILSEDTRVRTTVMTPEFNQATVRDVLEDLRRSSGSAVMAVLDVKGKVRAVAGSDSLRGMDLGASPLIARALESSVSHVWTFPEQVLVISLAPVLSGGQVAALLLVGQELGAATLGSIEKSVGVAGAVVIQEKVAASSSTSAGLAGAVQAALALPEGQNHVVHTDREYVVRLVSTGQSAGSGRVVWAIPMHQYGGRMTKLQILGWMPIVLVGLSLALAVSLFRRRANGEAA